MMDMRILKVTHSKDEFRKLLPHVQWAHVWAPENAGGSEEEAVIKEDAWEELLNAGLSRTKFSEITRRSVGSLPQNHATYVAGMNDYLFRSRVPFWIIERFLQAQSDLLRADKLALDDLYDNSLIALLSGDIDSFMGMRKRALEIEKPLNEIRDKEIGRNINRAEEEIRERYIVLKNRQPLNVVVEVGGLHWPESYISVPAKVVNLATEATSLNDLVCERSLMGSSYDELRPLILASGVADLARNGYVSLTREQIETLDFEGLTKVVRGVGESRGFHLHP